MKTPWLTPFLRTKSCLDPRMVLRTDILFYSLHLMVIVAVSGDFICMYNNSVGPWPGMMSWLLSWKLKLLVHLLTWYSCFHSFRSLSFYGILWPQGLIRLRKVGKQFYDIFILKNKRKIYETVWNRIQRGFFDI